DVRSASGIRRLLVIRAGKSLPTVINGIRVFHVLPVFPIGINCRVYGFGDKFLSGRSGTAGVASRENDSVSRRAFFVLVEQQQDQLPGRVFGLALGADNLVV